MVRSNPQGGQVANAPYEQVWNGGGSGRGDHARTNRLMPLFKCNHNIYTEA